MANERNAGRKLKYTKGTKTTYIREMVPVKVLKEIKDDIQRRCEPFKLTSLSKPPQSNPTTIAVKKVQDENLERNVKLQEKRL